MIRSLLPIVLAAAPLAAQTASARPLGEFLDDYGSRHTITDSSWTHHPAIRYRITQWDSTGRHLIARNTDSTWSRIDWMELDGMAPWQWAFCVATWNAPSADSAARVTLARRETPRTGCGGFPFTRMRRASGGGGASLQPSGLPPHPYQ